MIAENDFREIVAQVLEMDADEIPFEASFANDLGMDSLRVLEIVASLEKKFKIQIPPERLKEMENLKGVIAVGTQIYEETYANDDI